MKTRCCWFQIGLWLWAMMLPIAGRAQFNYVTTNGVVAITAYTGGNGAVVIPSTINGLPVAIVGSNAFQNCSTIVTVTIPSSITNMGMNAFVACPNLTTLYFRGNAPSLQVNASLFSSGPGVVTIYYLPGTSGWSSTYSGRPAVMFNPPTPAGSLQMTFSSAASSNGAQWQVDGGVAQPNGAIVKGLSVGNHVVSFGPLNGWATPPNQTVAVYANSNTFASAAYCRLIYTNTNGAITITGYTNAGSGVVVLPSTIDGLPVTGVGSNAFQNYTGLTNVTIPGSVITIGKNAFLGCNGLKAVYLQGNAPFLDPSNPSVFSGAPTIYYPPGTSGWGSFFANCPTVMLNPPNPAGSLKVNIAPNAVYTNGGQWQVDGGVLQFAGATVSGLSVGNHTMTFTRVNGWAMPESQTVAISSNATTTVTGTYGQLIWTTNSGTITITGYTGPGTDVVLPDTINGMPVVAIQGAAFQFKSSLVSITIPNSITNIGGHALANCSSLTSVYFQGSNPPVLGSGVFENDASATVYYPPGTSGWSSPFGDAPAAMLNPPSPSGSLQVTLSPTSITNGTQWRVDGGPAQFSGAIVSGLSVGSHTVSFGPANGGWAMPADKVVAVSADSTNTASAVYTQLNYSTNNGAIIITGYNGFAPGIVLPSAINGLPVVAIQGLAFQFRPGLTNITIPDSVTNIGVGAFNNCFNLVSVKIGSGVYNIDFNYIDPDLFNNCTNLTAITVDTNNPVYSSVAGVLFDKYQTAVIKYPLGGAKTYTIPDSVAYIVLRAFENCSGLTNITISTNVTTFGGNAFLGCSRLKSLAIPNSVLYIGSDAFRNCSGLTNVIIGTSVNTILPRAFQGCSGLTTVTIPSSVTFIWADAFSSCSNLTGIYFQGDAPYDHGAMISGATQATAYFLPWTARWVEPGTLYSGMPAALWLPQAQTNDDNFGVRTNQFGFNITWGGDVAVVVEACTDLANPVWTPVSTNTLVGGTSYFSDPQWTNYPGRFYRVRWQ